MVILENQTEWLEGRSPLKTSYASPSLVAQCRESACQCRRQALDPWSGKIPHAVGQLSFHAETTEAQVP